MSSVWLKWKEQQKQYETKHSKSLDMSTIKQNLMETISYNLTLEQCKTLEKALNAIFKAITYNDINANEFLNKVKNKVSYNINNLGDLYINKHLGDIQSSKINNLLIKKQNLKKQFQNDYKSLESNEEFQKIQDELQSLYGTYSNFRGDYFEYFLQQIGDITNDFIEEFSEKNIDNFVEQAKNKLQDKNLNLKDSIGSYQSTVNIQFGNKSYGTIKSKDKVDVKMPSPFIEGEELLISAKALSKLGNINLLSGANLAGLISQGILKEKKFNSVASKYIANALTTKDNDWTEKNIQQLKQIFFIEALSGQKSYDITGAKVNKANVLIVMINENKNPIRVIPIIQLLNKINNDQDSFNKYVIFNPDIDTILPISDGESRQNEPIDIIETLKSYKLSISLNKKALYLKFINNL